MACKLTRQPSVSFRGPMGSTVRIDVRSDQPARTVRITYAGQQDGEAPFEFQIKAGAHKLLLVAAGLSNNQRMRVAEVDAAGDCHLKNCFCSSQHFHTTLDIEGV